MPTLPQWSARPKRPKQRPGQRSRWRPKRCSSSAGLAAARAEGRVGGRRKKLDAAKRREIAESVISGRCWHTVCHPARHYARFFKIQKNQPGARPHHVPRSHRIGWHGSRAAVVAVSRNNWQLMPWVCEPWFDIRCCHQNCMSVCTLWNSRSTASRRWLACRFWGCSNR